MAAGGSLPDDEIFDDPVWMKSIIDAADKEEMRYERGQLISSMAKATPKTRQITSYFPLLSQPKSSLSPVYVAKYKYNAKVKAPEPPENCINVVIHTSAKKLGGALSPYIIADKNGCLLENLWQFSKLYPRVTARRDAKSRWETSTIIWEHPFEVHIDPKTGDIHPDYWAWRKKGFHNPYAVRYPNGFDGRRDCQLALWPAADQTAKGDKFVVGPRGVVYEKLTYVEARKKIYCALYIEFCRNHPEFKNLKRKLDSGQKLQIVEVDGPNPDWYTDSPIKSCFLGPSLNITESVIHYLINNESHPFGHGYVIAALLLGGEDWLK